MREKLVHTIKAPISLAVAGVGLDLTGTAFNSPAISSAGKVATGFVGPAVNIVTAGYVIKQLRGLKK